MFTPFRIHGPIRRPNLWLLGTCLCLVFLTGSAGAADAPEAVALPPGVTAVWDSARAWRATTPTRERVCLNGLWQWQPAGTDTASLPLSQWGYFKVPGSWPGITDYLQKDCQTVFSHPAWAQRDLPSLTGAWYRREFQVPREWSNRRIALSIEYLNSFATVYVDGNRIGELHFPGGEVDLSAACRPGATHTLTMLVVAMPLKGVILSYTDSASARQVKGAVNRRGLCGDVFLTSTPRGPRVTDIRTAPSVRHQECTIDAAVTEIAPGKSYRLRASLAQAGSPGKVLTSPPFTARELTDGRFKFTAKWIPERLWDTHTPKNLCQLELSLLDEAAQIVDTAEPLEFGFREFWIEGRDFYLNGTRIFLSAVPLDNAQVNADLASYAAARESLERLKSIGINFVYTHNYGCQPGTHLAFTEILRAADDTGMLVSFSQPHFSHYEWTDAAADRNNGYAKHAEFFTHAAQNHPAVVMYSMSHNAAAYDEDMNPDLLDGEHDVRDKYGARTVVLANRAEAIVHRLDPDRVIYHHASGNLGSMHVMNFYPNFAPVQELSDWFGHWATAGVKPAFMCEYGAPFTWDWTMYRGWYKDKREFGSAVVPWEFCLAEWNAQFVGDRAFPASEPEKANLRWEARQFGTSPGWHRWDYPNQVGSQKFTERFPVFAEYLTDNWRSFRTWGVSGISPWEYEHFWTPRAGVDRLRKELPVDWAHLQRPGYSADYRGVRSERLDLAFERADWVATPAATALLRNNRPLLAWIAGPAAAFTDKEHNFRPGQTVTKQLILINNSRTNVTADCTWSLGLPQPRGDHQTVTIAPGQQTRLPLAFELPPNLATGRLKLSAAVKFGSDEVQADEFLIDVLPPSAAPAASARIALFDPAGETAALLKQLGLSTEKVTADANLAGYDLLIVGKSALSVGGAAPDISRVREGLKVLLFEQTAAVLEQRFGFRVEEYGLRRLFPRVPGHPALAGLTAENLNDWHGAATLTPTRLTYETDSRYGLRVPWAGIQVPRLWRCGNRGNLASVLIEKPAVGDFLPVLDGGYSLQFSPLLEFREGRGLVVFCQLDVTGRTEAEPAAELLTRNLLQYVATWTNPSPRREAVYAGSPAGRQHLASLGLAAPEYTGGPLAANQVLILGPGAGATGAGHSPAVATWLKAGGNALAIGLPPQDVLALFPLPITLKPLEHISTSFASSGPGTPFAGIGPADVHVRAPRNLPLVVSGATVLGDGVLAQGKTENIVFCQLEPWQFSVAQPNTKRTFRRTSFLLSRLLANLGVAAPSPLINRFHQAVSAPKTEKRWLTGFYLDQPDEWDDPYRHFRW